MASPRSTKRQKSNNSEGQGLEWLEDELDDGDYEPSSRTVFLVGDIEEGRIKKATKSVIALAEEGGPDDPIYLYVSTLGGEVYEALALYDLIKCIPQPVHTKGFGKIMSAGCLLLAAGSRGHRAMSENAVLMYHAGFEDACGNVWEMEASLREFKRTEGVYDKLFARECGCDVAQVEALYATTRVNNFMDAQQALAFGVVDTIVPVHQDKRQG